MSAIESLRHQYADDFGQEDSEHDNDDDKADDKAVNLLKVIERNKELKHELEENEDQSKEILQDLKAAFLASCDCGELLDLALTNVDHTGDYLGLEDVHVELLKKKYSSDKEKIVIIKCLEKHVAKIITQQSHDSILDRRSTLHLLASIVQVQNLFDDLSESLDALFAAAFNHLGEAIVNWTELTPMEISLLEELTNKFVNVPNAVKLILSSILNN
jgi:hypothetical protein